MHTHVHRTMPLRGSSSMAFAGLLLGAGIAVMAQLPRAGSQTTSPSAAVRRLRAEAGKLSSEGKYEAAAERYRRIVKLQPSAAAYADLAQILESAGHSAQAAEAARAALRLDPNLPAPHRLLGALDEAGGQHASAIAHYQAALRNNASDRNTLWGLGTAFAGAQKWSQAEQAFANAIAVGPANSDDAYALRVRRGVALYRMGQRNAAVREWEKVPMIARARQPVPEWQKEARTLLSAMALLGEVETGSEKPARVAHR